MAGTVYVNLTELTDLQTNIMKFVDWWVHEEKTPVPQRNIIKKMLSEGVNDFTTVGAIKGLLLKGYLRKATMVSHKTRYVQLRRV